MDHAQPAGDEHRPLVSFVVPNFNGGSMLEQCLNSLLGLHFPRRNFEIIVVDNGSTDGSREMVRQKQGVRLVALPENEGFGKAVNVGAIESKGEYIAPVNNDVELSSEWLHEILTALSGDKRAATATGKLMFKHRPEIINDLGALLLLNGVGLHRSLGCIDTGSHKLSYVGAPTAAACLIRKSDFFALGGFDASYFAYFEDDDLGWRFWQRGRRVICVPSAVAYHGWRSTSMKFGSRFKSYHDAKNSFASLVKNAESRFLPEAFLMWALRLLFDVTRSARARDARAVMGIVQSGGWCFRNLRRLITKRRNTQVYRVVSDAELIRLKVLGRLGEGITEILRLRRLHEGFENWNPTPRT